MTGPSQDVDTAMLLGEIKGQLREIIHRLNNRDAADAATARQLAKLEVVPEQITRLDTRMLAMEVDKHHRDGAFSLGGWLMKSPVVAWIVGLGVAAWAYFEGAGK